LQRSFSPFSAEIQEQFKDKKSGNDTRWAISLLRFFDSPGGFGVRVCIPHSGRVLQTLEEQSPINGEYPDFLDPYVRLANDAEAMESLVIGNKI
jgi:hypothetical protein